MGLLNYQTILSSYDDKLTLMQWLKKVEAALNNAAAVAFNVNKRGDATLTFSIVFEDGSELESGPIVLQQGESVESAAIVGGHLLLTLTNGDVLDAGELLNGDLNVTGNVTATGNISAGGDISATGNVSAVGLEATGTGVETDVITASGASLDIFAPVVNLNNGLAAQGPISSEDEISTPAITSDEAEIEARKPIVEVMTGYSAISKAPDVSGLDIDYVGVVKNGHKITFAVAGTMTKDDNTPYNAFFVEFNIPASVGALLYPMGNTNAIDVKPLLFIDTASVSTTGISLNCALRKNSNTNLFLQVFSVSSLTANTTLNFRYECTFLLSNSLVS